MKNNFILHLGLVFQLSAGNVLPAWASSEGKNSSTTLGTLSLNQKVDHVLNRLTFGPRPGDTEKVRQMGIDHFIEMQLNPDKIPDPLAEARLRGLETLTMSSAELVERYPRPSQADRRQMQERDQRSDDPSRDARRNRMETDGRRIMNSQGPRRIIAELSQAKLLRAVYSERQLQEVMVDFWFNHFNVFAGKGADRWLITEYEREAIRPHALGNFRDLVTATAKSPAMLFYLDNWLSSDPEASERLSKLRERRARRRGMFSRDANPPAQAARSRGLNENYARELMELHTLGVDGGYSQKDITEVARCFTGWTIARPRQGGGFNFVRFLHDDREKTVLGHKIPSGGGIQDGERVIDILVNHPSTARFIATKLCRRFVSDEPPETLINKVAKAFRTAKGDITHTLRTLFQSPEFYSPEVYRAKIKTPFELVVSSFRALGAETEGSPFVLMSLAKLGEPLYLCQPPTGYPDVAEAWVNTGAMLNRLNFGLALAANRITGTRVDLQSTLYARQNAQPTDRDPSTLPTGEMALQQLSQVLLQGEVSEQTLATVRKQLGCGENPEVDTELVKVAGLLLGSPEFQRQ